VFGYLAWPIEMVAIGGIGFGGVAHHMYTVGRSSGDAPIRRRHHGDRGADRRKDLLVDRHMWGARSRSRRRCCGRRFIFLSRSGGVTGVVLANAGATGVAGHLLRGAQFHYVLSRARCSRSSGLVLLVPENVRLHVSGLSATHF